MAITLTCAGGSHVFTPLYPGWEPDDLTPCDCGVVTWHEHRLALLRAAVDERLELEAPQAAAAAAAGPDPEICNAPHPTRGICGGRMAAPYHARRSGVWIRSCTAPDCRGVTTCEPPVGTRRSTGLGLPVPGPLFGSIETVSRKPLAAMAAAARTAVDAKQRRGDQ